MIRRQDQQRALRATRKAEQAPAPGWDVRVPAAPAGLLFARVTSATPAVTDTYPAVITVPTEAGWEDAELPCLLRFARGGVPVADGVHECRPGYRLDDGRDVYVTASCCGEAGPGGGGGNCDLAGLRTTDCLLATGPGDDNTAVLHYEESSDGTGWVSNGEIDYPDGTEDGASGELVFWYAGGRPHLSLAGLELMDCGDGCFRGGALTGHVDEEADDAEACQGLTFDVCLSCTCCPIEGWEGPGWYCADVGDGCEPLYLEEEDACDEEITICSGPYPSEAAAEIACGDPPEPVTYPCNAVPGNYPVVTSGVFSATTGEAACLDDAGGAVTVSQTGPMLEPTNMANADFCEGNINFALDCEDDVYVMTPTGTGQTWTMVSGTPTEQVWFLEVAPGRLATGGGGGTAVLTLTGTFP